MAFTELVLTRNYDSIRMSDIAELANVGRSTVYQHYRDKDAVLVDSMGWVLDGLADCSIATSPADGAVDLLRHIWEHRDRARKVLFGATGRKLERALSAKIATIVGIGTQDSDWLVPHVFVANQIAASLFSILRSWVGTEASADAPLLAQHLYESARSLRHAALVKASGG